MADAISRVAPAISVSNAPRTAAPVGWQQAIDNVLKYGTYSEPEPFPPTMGLEKITGSKDGTHHATYINAWGGKDASGKFGIAYVTLVDEDWHLKEDGKFHIDQWLHQLSADGTSWQPTHNFVVEDKGGRVYDSGAFPQSESDASANLNNLIANWAKYEPAVVHLAANDDKVVDDAARNAAQQIAPVLQSPSGVTFPRTTGGFGLRQQ